MNRGATYALAAAVLFGMSTPLAKVLVGAVPPILLAGMLYAGSGVGLAVALAAGRMARAGRGELSLPVGREWLWLAAATVAGGIVGPVLLMQALVLTPAATASLLLNLEAVLTALIAWFVFRENVDRRIALGMAAIVAGGIVLAWQPAGGAVGSWTGSSLVAGACLCWALDNNFTRKVSASDATAIAALKGIVAGSVNLGIATALGEPWPAPGAIIAAAALGFVGYGVSLALFVLALRELGASRTSAYFSLAPFVGAAVGIAIGGDAITWSLVVAGVLMLIGVWLHVSEHHEHGHDHAAIVHSHPHVHDAHHRHEHDEPWDGLEPHAHAHRHDGLAHSHAHFPDVHHRHEH